MNKPIYQTMKVVFAEPIRALNEMFSDTQSWGVSTLKEWIDGYESTRFTAIDGHTAIIVCSKVNFPHFRFEKGTT